MPKESVSRVRMQTAVLKTALAENVTAMERELFSIPWELLSTEPEYIALRSRLHNGLSVLYSVEIAHTKRIKKEGTRLVKCGCAGCGYNFRITRMWIEIGIPKCPNQSCERFGKEMETDLGAGAYAEFTDKKVSASKRYAPDFVDPFADLPNAWNLDNWKG